MIRELSTETTLSGTRTAFHGRLNLQRRPLNTFQTFATFDRIYQIAFTKLVETNINLILKISNLQKKAKKADTLPNLMENALNSEKISRFVLLMSLSCK